MGPPPGGKGKGKTPPSATTPEASPKAAETPASPSDAGKGKAKGKGKGTESAPETNAETPVTEAPATPEKGKGKAKGPSEAEGVGEQTGKGKAKGKEASKSGPDAPSEKGKEKGSSQAEGASEGKGKGKGKEKGEASSDVSATQGSEKGKGAGKEKGTSETQASTDEQASGKGNSKGKETSSPQAEGSSEGKGKGKGKEKGEAGSDVAASQGAEKGKGAGKEKGTSETQSSTDEQASGKGKSKGKDKDKGSAEVKAGSEAQAAESLGKGKSKGKENGAPAKASMATKRFQATVRNAQLMRRGVTAFDKKGAFSCLDAVGVDEVRQVEDEEFEAVMQRMGNRSRAGTVSAAKAGTGIDAISSDKIEEKPQAPWEERPAWKPPEQVTTTLCRQVEKTVEVTSTFVFAASPTKTEGGKDSPAAKAASALTKRFQSTVRQVERMRRGAVAFSRKTHISALDAVAPQEVQAIEEEEMARVMQKLGAPRGRVATVSEDKAKAAAVDSLTSDVVQERPAAPWDPRPAWQPPEPVVKSVCRHVVRTEAKTAEFSFSNFQEVEEQASGDPQVEFEDALEQFNHLVEQLKTIAAASSDPEPVKNILKSLVGSASASTDKLMTFGAIGM